MSITAVCRRDEGKVLRRSLCCVAGWLVAILLACAIIPRAYERLRVRVPMLRNEAWRQTLEAKKAQIADTQWKDARPLHVFAGDSHIEFGPWYELCAGNYAIRNCGLGMARISHVAELVKAVRHRGCESVLLMCGINDLGAGESVETCGSKYEELLNITRTNLQPKRIIVLSVLQVRQSAIDSRSREINQRVIALNARLKFLCERHNATFVDVDRVVSLPGGGLRNEFTGDGLHLNAAGYRTAASVVCGALGENRHVP